MLLKTVTTLTLAQAVKALGCPWFNECLTTLPEVPGALDSICASFFFWLLSHIPVASFGLCCHSSQGHHFGFSDI